MERNATQGSQPRPSHPSADYSPLLLNIAIDTSGSLAPVAMRLVEAIGEGGARWSAGTWTSAAISRHLLSAIAVAVQRGNALAMLSGYSSAARVAEADQTEAE